MSWLGESFTSLTGQLSNLTKEVLNEGREEVGDYMTELSIANQYIRDLEGQCNSSKQELERVRLANTELEERCQATELQINSISAQYRLLLQNKEDEINELKRQWQHGDGEVTLSPLPSPTGGPERGYGYHSDEVEIVDLISSQREINKLATEVRRLRSERDRWKLLADGTDSAATAPIQDLVGDFETKNDSNGCEKTKIQTPIEELEQRLQDTIYEHQNQLTTLQDHYTSQLFQQQEHYKKEIALLNESLLFYRQHENATEGCDSESGVYNMQQKYIEEQRELAESKKEIECMKLREREKDRQLNLLANQLEKLQAEKLQLEESFRSSQEILSDLQTQLKEAESKREALIKDAIVRVVLEEEKHQQANEQSISHTGSEIEVARRKIEELEKENEKTSTSEVLQDIQAAQKRINDETIDSHLKLLCEKEEIVDNMHQTNERKLYLHNKLTCLQKSNQLLTSDIKKVIQSLGNLENQDFADIVESLNTEKDILKAYNEDLFNCLQQLEESSNKINSEDIPENDQHTSTSEHSKDTSHVISDQIRLMENTMGPGSSFDDFDQMSLTSSMSELSVRNRELDVQVKGLQEQIETYEREIEHFEFVRADWQTERQAMEDLLLNLRAKLRMKEESLSVAMAEKGLIAVKKKYPKDTQLPSPLEENEDADGEGMLERVEQQIEELTQSNAQLESEKDVLWVERNSLMEEVSTLRNLNQALTVQLNEIAQNDAEEEDKNSSREELAFSLDETLAEKETEILNLTHEKQFLEESLDQLDQQHQEAMVEVLAIKENLTKANKELQQEVCELKKIVIDKEEENTQLKTEVETMQEQLTMILSSPGEKFSGTTLKASASDVHMQPFTEEDPTATSPSKKETMKSIVDAFHTINSDNVHLEEEIIGLEESRKQLESQLEEMKQNNEKLTLENKKNLIELQGLKKMKNDAFQFDDDKKHLEEELGKTQLILATQVETASIEAKKYVAAVNELQYNLESVEMQNVHLAIQLSLLRGQNETLQKEMNGRSHGESLKPTSEEIEIHADILDEMCFMEKEKLKIDKDVNFTKMYDKQLQTAMQFCNTCHQSTQTTLDLATSELPPNDQENWKQKCADYENRILAFKSMASNSNLKGNFSQQNASVMDALSSNLIEHDLNRTKRTDSDSQFSDNSVHLSECDATLNNNCKVLTNLESTIKEQKQEIEALKTKLASSSNLPYQKINSNISVQDNVNKYKLMEEKVRQLEIEKEQMLSVMNEKSRECSNLKNEVHRLVNVVSSEKQALSKMQQDNQELLKQKEIPDQEMTKEAVQNLCRLIRDKDIEIEALCQKNNTLLAVIQQSSPDTSYIEEVLKEREMLTKQLGAYKSDREQIINALSQKHQESLNYHAEVQRLNSLLSAATSKLDMLQHHHESVSQQYEEKQKSLVNTQNEVISLKQRVSDLERQQMDLEQKHTEIMESRKSSVMVNITKEELDNQVETIEKLQNLAKEKDKWIFEKDRLIHELSQDLQKQLDNLKQKENEISILHRQTENLVMHLKDTKDDLNEAKEEDHNAKQQLGNVQSEIVLMKELNERLSMTVQEKEFEIKALQEKISTLTLMVQEETNKDDMQRILNESNAMQEKAQHFHHERDEALLALSQRQQETEELKNEVQRLRDKENRLNHELERLREHLVQVEESYTKEALNAEEREKQLRNTLSAAEENARMSSTAIHNASQLASSQVDSLQEQLALIAKQRDKALNQVSDYEDQVQQYSASLSNLQLVLEQFQKERDRDIQNIRKQKELELDREKRKIQELTAEIWQKEEQLAEATEAIDAASRLSEQLDTKEEIITCLRKEVSSLTIALQKSQDEMRNLLTNTEGKVDRQVMKSLVLGYFGAPFLQKPDVVRLLARVLDFNQEEMSKAGIRIGRENVASTITSSPNKKSGGWISGWFKKDDIQNRPRDSSVKEKSNKEENKSFSALFVQFLQNESQPQHNISLPAEEMAREMTMKSITHTRPLRINPFNPLPQRSASVTPPETPNKNTTYTKMDHPLIRPLSSSLPTFTPILVASDASATTSNMFLQEVLK